MKRNIFILIALLFCVGFLAGCQPTNASDYENIGGNGGSNNNNGGNNSDHVHDFSKMEYDSKGHYQVCSICNEKGELEKHNFKKGAITLQPNCSEDGERQVTCKVCGYETTEAVASTGTHTWDSGKISKPATCLQEGIKTYTCTVCDTTRQETLPKHSFDAGVMTTPVTCVSNGVKTYTCSVCKEKKTEIVQARGSHTGTYTNGKWSCCGVTDSESRPFTQLISSPITYSSADHQTKAYMFDISGDFEVQFEFVNIRTIANDTEYGRGWVMDIYSLTPQPWGSGGWSFRGDWCGWLAADQPAWGTVAYNGHANDGAWASKYHLASANMNVKLNVKYSSAAKTLTVTINYHSNISPYSSEDKTMTYVCSNMIYTGNMGIAIGTNGSQININAIKVFAGTVTWKQ